MPAIWREVGGHGDEELDAGNGVEEEEEEEKQAHELRTVRG